MKKTITICGSIEYLTSPHNMSDYFSPRLSLVEDWVTKAARIYQGAAMAKAKELGYNTEVSEDSNEHWRSISRKVYRVVGGITSRREDNVPTEVLLHVCAAGDKALQTVMEHRQAGEDVNEAHDARDKAQRALQTVEAILIRAENAFYRIQDDYNKLQNF